MATSRKWTGEAVIRWALLAVALVLAAAFLVASAQRVAYPYDIDFVEDGMLMQAWRVANGQPVYVAPSAGFAPHVYMPLYSWLGGLLLALTGPSFAPLRLLSLAATLTAAAIITAVGWRESGNRTLALASGLLYLAGFRIVGGWHDLARVDPLFIALTLAGLALVVYRGRSPAGQVTAAALLALAYLTKQNGLYFGLIAAAFLLATERRRGLPFAAAFLALTAGATAVLDAASQGWFTIYVFGVAFASPVEGWRALYSLGAEVLGDMAPLAAMAAVLAAVSLRRYRRLVFSEQPWLLFIAAAVVASLAGRASVGGARNQLIQAYAFLCLAPALLWRELVPAAEGSWARSAIVLGLVVQFGLTLTSPLGRLATHQPDQRYVPTAAMRTAGDRLVASLAATPGDVLVMMHPFYALRAGKEPSAQIQALWHARWRGREPLPDDLAARIEQRQYAAIVSDESPYFETEPDLQALIDRHYVVARHLTPDDAPPTLNGVVVRPQTVYVPRP